MNQLQSSDAALAPAERHTRRRVGRFAETRGVKLARTGARVLCQLAPRLAAHMTYALLSKPPRSPEKPWQAQLRSRAKTSILHHSGRELAVYEWGSGPTVLLVHGWGAHALHMGRMVDPLVDAGYRVVAFDAPAHGRSQGRNTDLIEFASAIATVAERCGPVHGLLAHSFGVSMALYAQRDWGVTCKRQVLLSSFSHCKWFTDAFAHYLSLKPEVMDAARQMMVERYGGRLDWDRLSVVELLRRTRQPTLLMHDQDDEEIPFSHSVALLEGAPQAQFHATQGLGHHRLLGNPEVIDRVVQFMRG
jgi:pimeloyl-ACP methyl ester carboxylesterase